MASRSLDRRSKQALDAGRRVCIDGLYSGAEWGVARSGGRHRHARRSRAPLAFASDARPTRRQRPLAGPELDARDIAEVGNVDKAKRIALADLHVVNDGSLDELMGSRRGAYRAAGPPAVDARLKPPRRLLAQRRRASSTSTGVQ